MQILALSICTARCKDCCGVGSLLISLVLTMHTLCMLLTAPRELTHIPAEYSHACQILMISYSYG